MSKNETQIWLRLGVTLKGNQEEIDSIIRGDEKALRRVLEAGRYQADGETYIPQQMVVEYNDEHNTTFKEEDIIFEL